MDTEVVFGPGHSNRKQTGAVRFVGWSTAGRTQCSARGVGEQVGQLVHLPAQSSDSIWSGTQYKSLPVKETRREDKCQRTCTAAVADGEDLQNDLGSTLSLT